jgi:hypothetical protein
LGIFQNIKKNLKPMGDFLISCVFIIIIIIIIIILAKSLHQIIFINTNQLN